MKTILSLITVICLTTACKKNDVVYFKDEYKVNYHVVCKGLNDSLDDDGTSALVERTLIYGYDNIVKTVTFVDNRTDTLMVPIGTHNFFMKVINKTPALTSISMGMDKRMFCGHSNSCAVDGMELEGPWISGNL